MWHSANVCKILYIVQVRKVTIPEISYLTSALTSWLSPLADSRHLLCCFQTNGSAKKLPDSARISKKSETFVKLHSRLRLKCHGVGVALDGERKSEYEKS
jgi:hypothetical protein